jgi:hypothetical protein
MRRHPGQVDLADPVVLALLSVIMVLLLAAGALRFTSTAAAAKPASQPTPTSQQLRQPVYIFRPAGLPGDQADQAGTTRTDTARAGR